MMETRLMKTTFRQRLGRGQRCLVLVLGLFSTAGCGPAEPLARVSGKVTFDGRPVQAGLVVLSNEQLGTYITAEIADGKYEVMTAKGNGLPPGDYRVAITPPLVDHPIGPILERPAPVEYADIPHRYRDDVTSGFVVQLRDGDNVADFDMAQSQK